MTTTTPITTQSFCPAICGDKPEQCQPGRHRGPGLLKTLKKWRQNQRGRQELGRLSDAMLKDIGITRSDADMEAEKPFWKD